MKILGVDYGLKHIGLALADSPLATPLATGHIDSLDEALQYLQSAINTHHPDRVVVGLPDGVLAPAVEAFVHALQKLTSVTVLTHPETLSSHDALVKLRSIGASRAKLKNDHAYAACLLVEDYLESLPGNNLT